MKQLQIKKYLNYLVQLDWLDAAGEIKEQLNNIKNVLPQSLLIPTKTYGKIYKIDEFATIILSEESETEVDYTVIPNSWIINITKLNANERRIK